MQEETTQRGVPAAALVAPVLVLAIVAFFVVSVGDRFFDGGPLCGKCQALAERGEAYPTCRDRGCKKCAPECCKPEQDRCCCLHRDACECPPPPQP